MTATPGTLVRPAVAWTLVLVAAAVVLSALSYRTRDPDSVLYAEIAARLSEKPIGQWIAPDWPPGTYMHGRFREHPAGLFIPAALLARLGYPAAQSAYLVNAFYQVLALLGAPLVASAFAGERESRRLSWLLQLLPVAFTYRIRANHEGAVLLLFVLALLGTERSRERPLFIVLTVLSLDALMLVKGLVVLPAALACVAWLVACAIAGKRTRWGWAALGIAAAFLASSALAYEAAYVRATGESFLDYYFGRATRPDPNPPSVVSDTLYNLVWYGGRVLWFSAPWSVLALLALLGGSRPSEPRVRGGVLFTVAVLAVYVGLFSLGERRAERYIFPVYFVVGAAGALVSMARWPRLERALARLDGPLVPPLVFAATFGLHLLGGALNLPRIQLWRPNA